MSNLAHSSFRNEARPYLLYVAAGVAAIPAGISYAILATKGLERWWTVVPLLALGLATALLVWKRLERQFNSRIAATSALSYNAQGHVYVFGLLEVGGVAAAASIAVLCSYPLNRPQVDQTNSRGQGNAFTVSPRGNAFTVSSHVG